MLSRTTVYPTRDAWLAARSTTLGASEAAPLLGLSSFAGPWDVVAKKRAGLTMDDSDDLGTDEAPDASDPRVRGQILEPAVLAYYREATGRDVVSVAEAAGSAGVAITRHPSIPWLTASLDAIEIPGLRLAVEAKTDAVGAWRWGASGTEISAGDENAEDVVPPPYFVQVIIQMAVADIDAVDLAVLCPRFRFRWIRVHRHAGVEEQIIRMLTARWNAWIVGTEDPLLDSSDECVAAMKARYSKGATSRRATEEEAGWISVLMARKAADRAADGVKPFLLRAMGSTHHSLTLPPGPMGQPCGVRRDVRGALTVYGD